MWPFREEKLRPRADVEVESYLRGYWELTDKEIGNLVKMIKDVGVVRFFLFVERRRR